MKIPIEWLREYVQTPLSDVDLANKLTMAGLEVEEITDSADGPVYHTKVTPNRGDWMSVLGTAREAAAALDLPLAKKFPVSHESSSEVLETASVQIMDPQLCPRYCGKVIRDVNIGTSPPWMQKRLEAAGMRAINVVVDVTNYVMLEYGQPLHAFDFDTLPEGKVIVRRAADGETLKTLDGGQRDLSADMLVIADQSRPIALAGIMGGADTEVTDKTRRIFLESAHFDPGTVRRTAKAIALSTEASYRFERNVNPELAPVALERATQLLEELAGGNMERGRVDCYPSRILAKTIDLRPARVNQLLGTTLSAQTIAHSLRRLGLIVDTSSEPMQVSVPTFRADITHEIDLAEEVGRMIGYDSLPETLPPSHTSGGDSLAGQFAQTIRQLLSGLGLQETLTHSLAAPSAFDDTSDAGHRVNIRLALSAELSGLRRSLTPNILHVLAHNVRRGASDISLFEIGKVFSLSDTPGAFVETRHAAAALVGASRPRTWDSTETHSVDFFTAKGIIETLFAALHLPPVTFASENRPQMHPGRCAAVIVGARTVGYVAEVDPDALKELLDLPSTVGRVAAFELDCDTLLSLMSGPATFKPLPRFPSVSRDINIVVDEAVPYSLLENTARSAVDSALTESISLQSVYTGHPIAVGSKAVALRLTFRSADRTLTDREIDSQMTAVESVLADRVHADRR